MLDIWEEIPEDNSHETDEESSDDDEDDIDYIGAQEIEVEQVEEISKEIPEEIPEEFSEEIPTTCKVSKPKKQTKKGEGKCMSRTHETLLEQLKK